MRQFCFLCYNSHIVAFIVTPGSLPYHHNSKTARRRYHQYHQMDSQAATMASSASTKALASRAAPGDTTVDWENGLCSEVCGGDCETCVSDRPISPSDSAYTSQQLCAWFCPCVLYGRSSQRMRNYPSTKEPELCDADCMLYLVAHNLCWLLSLRKRKEAREAFGIRGSGLEDFGVCGLHNGI